mmetsp:Transcript_97162/g.192537  ORF Transcript_97162/g.192537 Transcript_97162/m.192537 type:complete len:319 (-) Transcript_97162:55-1011(-)
MADDDTITLLLRLNKADLQTKFKDEVKPVQTVGPRTLSDCKMVWKEPVLLDIGGKLFKTTLTTLHRDGNSLLAQMFSILGFQLPRERNGSYFIDRDGEHFQHILNYLRGCFTLEGLDRATLNEIAYEAEFYQLRGLYELLRPGSPRSAVTRMASQPVGNGVLCQLGGGSSNWVNPATTGKVAVSGSFDSLINMIGRSPDKTTGSCHDARGKHLVLDLKSCLLKPTHCSMAYNGTCHTGASWSLTGCETAAGGTWKQLAAGQVWSDDCKPQLFAVTENAGSYYQQFKLTCVSGDNRGGNCFCFHVGQLELYGELHYMKS